MKPIFDRLPLMAKVALAPALVLLCLLIVASYSLWTSRATAHTLEQLTQSRLQIGEDVMNFAFNMHLMVGEIEKTMADGRIKILDLNWSPITDGADTTVRLLLCVRDVSELRKLAAEANEQRRQLEIIGEILAVSQEKFHEFIASSIKFIDENVHLQEV